MAAPLFALAQPYRPRSPRPKLHHATSFILLPSDGGDGSAKVLLHEGFVEPRHIVAAGWQFGIPGRQNVRSGHSDLIASISCVPLIPGII